MNIQRCMVVTLINLAAVAQAAAARASELTVDAGFPGGNVLVDRIQGGDVFLRQDTRDTAGWWFYWQFRVRRADGRTVRFHFTNKNVIGSQGPAYSLDDGATWQWLGPRRSNTDEPAPRDGFVFRLPAGDTSVRFCFSIPYVESDLKRFLGRHQRSTSLKTDVLCKSAKQRSVEAIYLGRLDGPADYRLAFTCRHHACESVANYVLEGFMEAVLAESDTGRWYRKHAAVLVIPFVDKDGVETGDQGKNRKPHDHNRDYGPQGLYAEVAAIKHLLPRWSGGRLDMALDLHCPYLGDSLIQFIGNPDQAIWQRTLALSQLLESCQSGPLRHSAKQNVPFGSGWNQGAGLSSTAFGGWARMLPGVGIAASVEIPYAQVGPTPVSADAARTIGRDLATAIRSYLEKHPRLEAAPQAGAK